LSLDRKISGFFALEDAIDVRRSQLTRASFAPSPSG
jgi:hypothetical protein